VCGSYVKSLLSLLTRPCEEVTSVNRLVKILDHVIDDNGFILSEMT
jgi:hypothetical protein